MPNGQKKKPDLDFEWGLNHALICGQIIYRPERLTTAEWQTFWETIDRLQKEAKI